MNWVDESGLLEALPYLIAAMAIAAIAMIGHGGPPLRRKRRLRQEDVAAKPVAAGTPPWSEWLREINERGRLNGAREKWRE